MCVQCFVSEFMPPDEATVCQHKQDVYYIIARRELTAMEMLSVLSQHIQKQLEKETA